MPRAETAAPVCAAIQRRTKKAINSLLLRSESSLSSLSLFQSSFVLLAPPVFLYFAFPRHSRRPSSSLEPRVSIINPRPRVSLWSRATGSLVFAPVRDAMPSRVQPIDDSIEISLVRSRRRNRRKLASTYSRDESNVGELDFTVESSPRFDPPRILFRSSELRERVSAFGPTANGTNHKYAAWSGVAASRERFIEALRTVLLTVNSLAARRCFVGVRFAIR